MSGRSPRQPAQRICLRTALAVLCLLAWAGTTGAQPLPPGTYLDEATFLEDVTPYGTLGFNVITPANLTVEPIPDPYNPLLLHYPEMTFGPVIVETPATTLYQFGFYTTDNYLDVWPELQALRDELIDGNALLQGPNGLRFRFSENSTQPVTAFGAYFGSIYDFSGGGATQRLYIEFWDGGLETVDVMAVRGSEQANEQFMGYSSPGRPIKSVRFHETVHNMLLDNFVYGYARRMPDDRVIRLSGDLSFGAVAPGGSASRTLRIHNDGTRSLSVTGLSYPDGFSGAWSGVIAPGTYQDVTVTFAPQAGGVFTGPVVVRGNQTRGVNTIPAFGLGTVPDARVIGLSGDFAFGVVPVGLMSQRTLRISNIGTGALTITGITYPSGFTGAWSGVIPAGSFVDVTVTFSPLPDSSSQGTITVSGDQTSGTNTILASVLGFRSPFSISGDLAFGAVLVGSSEQRTLRFTNTELFPQWVSFSYPWYGNGWAFSGPTGTPLVPPGGSVNVTITFTPQQYDAASGYPIRDYGGGWLGISDGSRIPVTGTGVYPGTRLIDVTGDLTFGTVLVGTSTARTIRIANKGSETLTIDGIDLPPGFSGGWAGDVPQGGVRDVTVTFTPTSATPYFGPVRVRGNQENHLSYPWETLYGGRRWTDFTMAFGEGSSQATRVILLGGDLAFGAASVGATATRTLRIQNLGSTTLTITGLSYPPGFSGAWSGSIPAGGSQDVPVTFAPTAGVAYAGQITVAGNQTSGSNTIPVSGIGATRQIELSGDLAFGGVLVGTTATRTLRIRNHGNAALNVTGISTSSTLFSAAWSGGVAPGGFQDVPVNFTPTAVSANIQATITVNATQTSGTATTNVSGWGTAPCQAILLGVLTPTTFTTGVAATSNAVTVVYGGYAPFTFSVTDGALPPGLALNSAPGYFDIRGTPTQAGTYTFTVTATDVIGCTGSRSYTVTVNWGPPGAFGRISPVSGAAGQPTTVTLAWQASIGATSYEYCLQTLSSSLCQTSWVSAGASTTATLSGLTGGQTYYWHVRALANGLTTYANGASGVFWNFTTAGGGPPPAAFGKTAPVNGATGQPTTLTLSWQASSGATSYAYCIDTVNNGACDTSWQSTGASTSASLTGLVAGQTYYWQVRASASGGTTYANGSASAFWSFTTSGGGPAFGKIAPVNGATGQPTTLTLSWQASSGATSYAYCIDTTDNGACDTVWQSAGGTTSLAITGLAAGQTYYWQVRASASGGTTYANGSVSAFWSFTTAGAPTDPPTGLYVSSVAGNVVTLRWTPPLSGSPTGYRLEGGVAPSQTLAMFLTGSAAPIYTFAAPTGSFFVRIRAMYGATSGALSNEVPLHVNVPVPPSAPADLLRTVTGSTIALAWKNTFGGGPPTSLVLDVTGSFNGSVPLGLGESVSFSGVPAGTYTVSLRALNAGGSSPASNAVVLTVPSAGCAEAPHAPARFLAYRSGNTISVIWEPAATGGAPTGYAVDVSGSYVGGVSTGARSVSGAVGPGSYGLRVAATNSCGASAFTPVQTVVVP